MTGSLLQLHCIVQRSEMQVPVDGGRPELHAGDLRAETRGRKAKPRHTTYPWHYHTVTLSDKGLGHAMEVTGLCNSDYTCEVDIMGRPVSITHKLEVLEPPRVLCRDSPAISLTAGESHILRCEAQVSHTEMMNS